MASTQAPLHRRSASPPRDQSPASAGFRMPAEWEPHAATWIAWPHNRHDWPGKFHCIPPVYAEIVRWLATGERVEIVVQDKTAEARASRLLDRAGVAPGQAGFHRWPTDRVWTRDSGPVFLTSGDPRGVAPACPLALLDWKFNAWAKYNNFHNDDRLPARIARRLKLPAWQPVVSTPAGRRRRVILEGGSIDGNGAGTLLTTEECLLGSRQQRNPGLDRAAYEQIFAAWLGATNVIWLGRGIHGDDTHGHVDDLARFVAPDTVVTVVETSRGDVNYSALRENLRRLRSARDQNGRRLRVVTLPMPRPVTFDGQRLPASYANFYIANQVVLVPVFNDPSDRVALNTLAGLFPGRDTVGIYCGDLIWGFGALHCMTQPQPR